MRKLSISDIVNLDKALEPASYQTPEVAEGKEKGQDTIRLTLLENGLDFILEAVNRLMDANHRDYKYAILHLCSGVELVFKERLSRADWRQVALNPKELTKSAYKSGDFQSVPLKECLKRLKKHGVSMESQQRKVLLRIRRKRNRIEHFDMEDTVEAIRSATATVLNVVFDFIHTELNPETLAQKDQDTLKKIQQRLFELQEFVETRLQEIKPRLQQAQAQTAVVTCPQCFQDAAVLDDGLQCLFCRDTASGEDAAESYISEVLGHSQYEVAKYGGIWPQHMCPECGMEALVDMDEGRFVCFACGMSRGGMYRGDETLQQCVICSQFYVPIDGLLTCEDCFDDYMRHN